MSEKQVKTEDAKDPDLMPEETADRTEASKSTIPPYVGIGLLIAALLVVLLVINIRAKKNRAPALDDKSVSAVSAELEATRSELNRHRMSMGLRPIENGSESIDDIAKRLGKDAATLVGLAGSFEKILAEKDLTIDSKNSELLRSEQLRQSLAAESVRLQGELQRSLVSGADGDLARRELANVKDQRDRLASALAKAEAELKSAAGGRSNDEFADLQRRYEEAQRAKDFFEKRSRDLENELGKLRIFAKSETELLPAAVELFRTLRGLEGKKDSDQTSAYSEIGAKLGANVLRTLNFQTGSSDLTPEEKSGIQGLVDAVPDGDLVLVVGYASTTGNVDANRVLSSDRATAAAQFFASSKRPGQSVQAVYIGQTNRFSSAAPERNQICEIWHIRAK